MRSLRFAMVGLTVALVAGGCSSSGSKHSAPLVSAPSTSTPGGAGSTEADLRQAIRTQGLTPERATELFALDVGSLPGVQGKAIAPDDASFDGTEAVSFLFAEWSQLTQ